MPNEQLPLGFISVAELPPIVDPPPYECPNCSGEFDADDGYEIAGEAHCPDCVVHCEECSTAYLDGADEIGAAIVGRRYRYHAVERNRTQVLCDDCAFTCADCSDRCANSNDHCANASDDRVCESCGENYYYCEDCGCILHGDDIETYHDSVYCRSCCPSDDYEDDKLIKSYEYKPTPTFLRADGQKVNTGLPYFGIELEVDGGGEDDSSVEECGLSSDDAFYCKHDGSLIDGFEIVSHPATYEWWSAHTLPFMPKLKRMGYKSYDAGTCGMHIHVSRKYMTKGEIFKLAKFFRNNPDFILAVSRRSSDNLRQWAKIAGDSTAGMVHKARYGGGDRYEALNLSASKTIEFRLFRGTLDIPAFRRNLAFTYSLCVFVKENGIGDMCEVKYAEWLRKNAVRVLGKSNGEARNLIAWIDSL